MPGGRRLVLFPAAAAAAGLVAAGVVHLAGARGPGLPAVGQVIPAVQRPIGPDISGPALTGGRGGANPRRGNTRGGPACGWGGVSCAAELPGPRPGAC